MTIAPYTNGSRDQWDELVAHSFNGTFLHSRRFLSYHGERFRDVSLQVHDSKGRLVGALPAAVNPSDPTEVVSHPGITYGGVIHGRELVGRDLLLAFEEILDTYRSEGFRRLLYKPVPRGFQVVPSEDDLYALFRLGAERCRCDLSAAIVLPRRARVSSRRARGLKRAARANIVVSRDLGYLDRYWSILSANLAKRHDTAPVHSIDEMRDLATRFPREIALVSGHVGSELVAGAVLFTMRTTVHTQYLASSERGREIAALDYVIDNCIRHAQDAGAQYFSFGVSTEQDGLVLNDGLHTFKSEFGAGGVVHEVYSLTL